MADWNCNLCKEYQSGIACTYCDDGSKFARMSNADHIRAMSDEELAEFLEQFEVCSHCEYSDKERCTFENPCVHDFATAMALKWLQSETE